MVPLAWRAGDRVILCDACGERLAIPEGWRSDYDPRRNRKLDLCPRHPEPAEEIHVSGNLVALVILTVGLVAVALAAGLWMGGGR